MATTEVETLVALPGEVVEDAAVAMLTVARLLQLLLRSDSPSVTSLEHEAFRLLSYLASGAELGDGWTVEEHDFICTHPVVVEAFARAAEGLAAACEVELSFNSAQEIREHGHAFGDTR